MQNDTRNYSIKKWLLVAAVCLIILVVSGITTVLILKKTTPAPHTPPIMTSPSSVIFNFTKPHTIETLSNGSYLQQDSGTANSFIRYQLHGHTYIVNTPTPDHVLFFAKNIGIPNESHAIQAQTTSFMHIEGYALTTPPPSTTGITYATYANATAICQLVEAISSATPSYYTLACVDTTSIRQQYTSIDSLLALYKKTHALTNFSEATLTTIEQGNKALSVIDLMSKSGNPLLLFAAISNSWQYIGNLADVTVVNGKYILDPTTLEAINNPAYDGFIIGNIKQWYYP